MKNTLNFFSILLFLFFTSFQLSSQISLSKPGKSKKASSKVKVNNNSDYESGFFLGVYLARQGQTNQSIFETSESQSINEQQSVGVSVGYFFNRVGIQAKLKLTEIDDIGFRLGANVRLNPSIDLGAGVGFKTFDTKLIFFDDFNGEFNVYNGSYENNLGFDLEFGYTIPIGPVSYTHLTLPTNREV